MEYAIDIKREVKSGLRSVTDKDCFCEAKFQSGKMLLLI
jgi:hypothetical protein